MIILSLNCAHLATKTVDWYIQNKWIKFTVTCVLSFSYLIEFGVLLLHVISVYLSDFHTIYIKGLATVLFLYSIKYSAHGKILQAEVKFPRKLSVKVFQHPPLPHHHPPPPPSPFRVCGEIEFGNNVVLAVRGTNELSKKWLARTCAAVSPQ